MNPWTWIVDKVTPPPDWMRGPIKSSINHAVITVLGLMPIPLGPFAIWYFIKTEHSWAWIVSSGITLVYYWIREYKQTGLKPKGRVNARLSRDAGGYVYRTFWQRYDTWFDVLFPTFAYGLQLGLLGWLW